jgi:hypothetical protein
VPELESAMALAAFAAATALPLSLKAERDGLPELALVLGADLLVWLVWHLAALALLVELEPLTTQAVVLPVLFSGLVWLVQAVAILRLRDRLGVLVAEGGEDVRQRAHALALGVVLALYVVALVGLELIFPIALAFVGSGLIVAALCYLGLLVRRGLFPRGYRLLPIAAVGALFEVWAAYLRLSLGGSAEDAFVPGERACVAEVLSTLGGLLLPLPLLLFLAITERRRRRGQPVLPPQWFERGQGT